MAKHEAEKEAVGTTSSRPPLPARWSKPLRVYLSIAIVALLISISVPLMWLTYHQGRTVGIAAGEAQMRQLSLRVIDSYRTLFGDGYSAIATASVLTPFLSPPPMELQAKQDFLLQVLRSSANIDGFYVGYPGGSFVHAVSVASNPEWLTVLAAPDETVFALRTIEKTAGGPVSTWRFLTAEGTEIGRRTDNNVTYDPSRRPWYRSAVHEGAQVSVGPYVSATTKSLSLTLAMPMAKNRQIVAGADVLLETISHLLNREAVSENGRGYVFDGQNRLIVHSDPVVMDRILETLSSPQRDEHAPISDSDPALEPIGALLSSNVDREMGTVLFDVGGEPYLAQISPVEFSGLLKGNTVVLAAPLEDFIGESKRFLAKTMMIAAAFVLTGMLAALLFSRRITTTLYALAGEAQQIGNLEFASKGTTQSRISEINVLANALAAARDAIRTFSLYVPRELVRRIVNSGQAIVGSASRQEVTVLFSDIQDFTTISERHSPEEVVDLLSTYFERMNEIVEAHGGVIVQYIGDSVFAMWNAPVADPSHVEHGCRCVLAMKAAIDDLNRANRAAGRPELITRYGLHTGPVVVGSVGAQSRRQYTAMGDTVNVGSRLEGMNKLFGTTILVSLAVEERAGGGFRFRSLGLARAKGRHEQIEVFELLGEGADAPDAAGTAAEPGLNHSIS